MRAFVFPGQGAQTIGMGQDLAASYPAAKAVFEEVDDALGQDLSGLIWNGEIETLTLTANAQPALMATSLAAVRALQAEGLGLDAASFVAGHSLGEYAALAASGSLSISDAARLLRQRGDSMQSAVPVGEGAMAAVLGGDEDQINAILNDAKSSGLVQIANDNAPGQIVISGESGAVDAAIEIAKATGLRRAIKLPVSAPFHCDLMAPAADVMAKLLADTDLSDELMPVYCNVSAAAETRADHLRANLVTQVTARVRWRESLMAMSAAGATKFIELGTGKVLSGLVKRSINSDAVVNMDGPDDLDSVLAEM